MKKQIILFTFILPFLLNSQSIINYTIENANIYEYDQSILITPIDSNIILSGDFFTYKDLNEISILIVPNNGFEITIIPNQQGQNKSSIGIGEGDDKSININLYPNPTKEKLTINTTEKIKKIELFNNYGFKQPIINNNNILNLKTHKKGIYLLKIHLENNQVITKTIIKN